MQYYFQKKGVPFDLYMINLYWTTFETLAEIERDCKERQLCKEDWVTLCCIRDSVFDIRTVVNKVHVKREESFARDSALNTNVCIIRANLRCV